MVEKEIGEARDTLRAMLKREYGAYDGTRKDTYGGSNDNAGDPTRSREPLPYLQPTIQQEGDSPFPGLDQPLG